MSLAAILPLSLVMIAGPQIISAFFLATSEDWAKNSLSYLAGAALSITAVVTLAYVVAKGAKVAAGAKQAGTTGQVIDGIVLGLVLFLIGHVYLTRNTSEPRNGWESCKAPDQSSRSCSAWRCSASSRLTSSARSRPACTSHTTAMPGGSAFRSWH